MARGGLSQRPVTTLAGASGRAYRSNLPSGVEYRMANVGGPLHRSDTGLDQLRLTW